MVSLWNKKKDHGDEDGAEHREESSTPVREPDERTRLLPREPPREPPRENHGYLSPDDPAVSPYNIWGIRAVRGLAAMFLAVSFIWWTFLLVSLFVSPPMMHTRGSGFFGFAFTTLTVIYLVIGLIFFAIPSKPITIWGVVLSIFLIADMCIILGVRRLRVEEGWIGVASVVWATFISIFNVIQNRYVGWGKREEEERLTGREETRRSLREWLAVLIETVVMAVLAIVSIFFTATLILCARDASLEAPGKRYAVSNDDYKIHLACVGSIPRQDFDGDAPPTILVEGGEEPVEQSLQPFIDDLYQNGTIDRYCYYDRPGIAWSDNAPSPHSAGMTADALSEALAIAGEDGPFILVSAGVGGIYSRIFASRHLLETRGIFLIDGLHEDFLSNIGRPGRGFLIWIRGVLSPLGLDRLAGALFKGRTREDRVFGRSAYQSGNFLRAELQENLVAESMTASEIGTARHAQMGDTPLVVVSSGIEVRRNQQWAKKQEDLTKITENLQHYDIVKGAPHEVWRSSAGREILGERLRQLVKT